MDADTWAAIEQLRRWLDAHHHAAGDDPVPLRILKIMEEAGEVAAAYHGVLGANPRKGVTHTLDDVRLELCDVIATAAVALATLCPDPQAEFRRHLDHLVQRALPPNTPRP
ncbi:hypothetical protein B4N89_45820 [Embleya scabrispora]|uniref:NTP pyrophosphohydrolase MazG putative catalytic core domain-containing protein n=2 Tax=Embleya scabrispora TaxID=159449 RepID=A0A1T3NJL9_9ACTN|nr:hypothetical protein B4N89_45820 [Embleya scabrispora]